MEHRTPLPLSQQILAWLLGGIGRKGAGELRRLSETSVRNAINGRIVPRSWRLLVDEVLVVLDLQELDSAIVEGLTVELREWDARVSELDDCGLPMSDRFPAEDQVRYAERVRGVSLRVYPCGCGCGYHLTGSPRHDWDGRRVP